MSLIEFRDGLDSPDKVVRHMCSNIVNIRRIGGSFRLDPMPVRLLLLKLLKRV